MDIIEELPEKITVTYKGRELEVEVEGIIKLAVLAYGEDYIKKGFDKFSQDYTTAFGGDVFHGYCNGLLQAVCISHRMERDMKEGCR